MIQLRSVDGMLVNSSLHVDRGVSACDAVEMGAWDAGT